MSEVKKEPGIVVVDLETVDLSTLDEDSQIDIVLTQLEQYVLELEARGCPMEVIDTALFSTFVARLAERGDRESFDSYVEEAMDEEWPSVTVH